MPGGGRSFGPRPGGAGPRPAPRAAGPRPGGAGPRPAPRPGSFGGPRPAPRPAGPRPRPIGPRPPMGTGYVRRRRWYREPRRASFCGVLAFLFIILLICFVLKVF